MRRIFGRIINKILEIRWINSALLKMNNFVNTCLIKLVYWSFAIRAIIYGGGGRRLSNDMDVFVYYRWKRFGDLSWIEPPTFNIQALKMFKNPNVLELGCANAWYYRKFYCFVNNLKYLGCDIDKEVIQYGREEIEKLFRIQKKWGGATVVVADFLTDMPGEGEDFTNVFWFESFAMFEKEQRQTILNNIKIRLEKNEGILSGSAMLRNPNILQWQYYIALVEDKESLKIELEQHFRNVFITEMSEPSELYFMASDGELPLY